MHESEHRHFSRIQFHHGAHITIGGFSDACQVIDLSLKGALLRPAGSVAVQAGADCLLELVLDDGVSRVRMAGQIAHSEAGRIGMVCRSIDLDSITHLRRLIELNLGDATLLEREFAALLPD